MRSRTVKVILMGRVLEILHSHNIPSCNGMLARDIANELGKARFNRTVEKFIESGGGITSQKVAHLLTEMKGDASQPPFGLWGTPLVLHRLPGKRGSGFWKVRGKYG